MATEHFFVESSAQSRVKVEIVSKYFRGWANVMASTTRKRGGTEIGYTDLFAGPGEYADGTRSTPLLILEQAVADPKLREMLVTHFNDADRANADALRQAIAAIPGIETLKHAPVVTSKVIDLAHAAELERMRLPPTLFFIDPWGYIGLSLRLLRAATRSWGSDCIFFFNYKRINAGLGNDLFAERMNDIFGEQRANRLRPELVGLSPRDRESRIVAELLEALKVECGEFALQFPFATDTGACTSHYLMFVTKGRKGHDIMKAIMAPRSSASPQGVPSFGFNPAEQRQPLLPFGDLDCPLAALEGELLADFKGRRLTFQQLFDEHNVGKRYVRQNYRDVLLRLEERGRIVVRPPATERPARLGKLTMPLDIVIAFPKPTT